MELTAWHIDKLIRGLHAYRLMKAANGKLLPWKTVHRDVLLSHKTAHKFPEYGRAPEFKEEALRRFALGQSTLQAEKLEDVRLFLIDKGVLKQDELSEEVGVMTDGLILHTHLASDPERAAQRFSQLSTSYRAARNNGGRVEDFELLFLPQPVDTLVHAEERFRVIESGSAPTRYEGKDKNVAGVIVRKGCALITSEYPTLHVFLRGGSQQDLIHYVRVGTDGMQKLDALLLVRSGTATPEVLGQAEGDDMLARYNIVRFSPTSARTVLQPKKTRGRGRRA